MKSPAHDAPSGPVVDPFGFEGSGTAGIDPWQLAMRHKWRLAAAVVVGLLVGAAAYAYVGPEYEATAKILVSKKASVPLTQEQAQTFGERGEHIALILSPMIVGQAVEDSRLDKLPSLAGEEHPAEAILESLRVKRVAGTDNSALNVLDIGYRNPIEADACAIIAAVIDSYRKYLETSQQAHSDEALKLITEASDSLLARMREAEKEYLEFRESAPLHWKGLPGSESAPAETTNVHQQRLDAIEAQRRDNLLKRAEISSKLEAIQQAIADGDSPRALRMLVQRFLSVDSSSNSGSTFTSATAGSTNAGAEGTQLAALETQLLPLLLEERRLLRDFGKDHPDIRSVRDKIATIREFYRTQGVMVPETNIPSPAAPDDDIGDKSTDMDFVNSSVQLLKQQLAELENRDRGLSRVYEQEAELEKEYARYAAKDRALNDELQRIKHVWQLAVTRLNELNLLKDQGGYRLEQIAPVRAEGQIKRLIKFVGGGLCATLAIVGCLIYWSEMRDTTLHSPDDIRNTLKLPLLGGVPELALPRAGQRANQQGLHPQLWYYFHPGSSEAEAYRSIRTALLAGAGRLDAKTIQITSPEHGDGKTTFVSNLAIAAAQSGKRVLLIDCDFRNPGVHALFGLPQSPGLADVLAGEIDLATVAQELAIDGLSILTSGNAAGNPSERLSSPKLDEILKEAARHFDLVLVDSPSLLSVSDSCVVAGKVDGVLLVLRLDKNTRAVAQRAVELLDTYRFPVIGVVANGGRPADGDFATNFATPQPPLRQENITVPSVSVPTGEPLLT